VLAITTNIIVKIIMTAIEKKTKGAKEQPSSLAFLAATGLAAAQRKHKHIECAAD
jgi:hypothetical protein